MVVLFGFLRPDLADVFLAGVRTVSLWSAYVVFDWTIVVAVGTTCTIIFAATKDTWYHLEYLFVVFMLYGLASTLLAYIFPIFSKSQLASFALSAGGEA